MAGTRFLKRVEIYLDLPPGEKTQVLREIESHLAEIREELIASGMNDQDAQDEAERRFGSPEDIAARLSAVHNTASWKSAILTAAPFAASALVILLQSLDYARAATVTTAIVGIAALLGSVREFRHNRRPVWLPVWTAMAMFFILGIVAYIIGLNSTREAKIFVVIGLLGLIPLAVAAVWSIRRWLHIAVALAAIGTILSWHLLKSGPIESGPIWPLFVGALCVWGLLIIFARGTFEVHVYGSVVKASLFLLALAVLQFPEKREPTQMLQCTGLLACALLMIWFARAPRQEQKVRALKVALFASALASRSLLLRLGPEAGLVSPVFAAVSFILSAAFNAFLSYTLFVGLPIWLAGRQRSSALPPQIAQ